MLEKRQQLPQEELINPDYFIYCLEAVNDVEIDLNTEAQKHLVQLSMAFGVASIYRTCDTIEDLESSLNTLILDDHYFKDYEIIYLITSGESNHVCINDYCYSLQEIAEIFEDKLNGKILHFSNSKILDIEAEEAQYFLDVTGAKAISGYGNKNNTISSYKLDMAFFNLFKDDDDMLEVVELLHKKHYNLCKTLDFRLYY